MPQVGAGDTGQLGDGGTADQGTPVRVRTPRGVALARLAADGTHTCGISGAATYCWGANFDGELGNGGTTHQRTPVRVRTPRGVAFTQVTAGDAHTCGISGTRTFCWGNNINGELGDGGTTNRTRPVEVVFSRPR